MKIIFTQLSPIQIQAMKLLKMLDKHGKPKNNAGKFSVIEDNQVVWVPIIREDELVKINKYCRDNFDSLRVNLA